MRIAILVGALVCLGLAMYARTQRESAPADPPATAAQPAQQQPPQNAEGTGQAMELEEGKMGKKDLDFQSATKAPGGLYR